MSEENAWVKKSKLIGEGEEGVKVPVRGHCRSGERDVQAPTHEMEGWG